METYLREQNFPDKLNSAVNQACKSKPADLSVAVADLLGGGASAASSEKAIKEMIVASVKEGKDLFSDPSKQDAFNAKYYYKPDDFMFVRPSGNPMGLKMFEGMRKSGDVTMEKDEVKEFVKVEVLCGGRSAAAAWKQHSVFTYKDTPNNDLALFSATLVLDGGLWKFVHVHRATGQEA